VNTNPNQSSSLPNGYCATIGCSNGIGRKRAQYGHLVCKACGELNAREARLGWCVAIPYSKGAYQLITDSADLCNTNPKLTKGMK